ncbi:MAG TPA: class III extradiol ring-cleavage dioxygenase [Kofleriaceae bacterium]|jgi:aromatic ring-opening dioxygenase catalytic subunit (LigB family)
MRMPTVYVPHGGGPWPFVEIGIGSHAEQAALASYLRDLSRVGEHAKAVLVISAHWEEDVPTVMTSPSPPMLYDYYGFPPESYEITWPAPGDPALAARVRSLLERAGFHTAADDTRGYDHGTFVPLKLAYPRADLPVCQLSLVHGLDPATHVAIGRALATLRDEGVFIIGSGLSYHNLRAFGPPARPVSIAFDAWLRDATTRPQPERDRALVEWTHAPSARLAHPREEHLMPLMVIAGAAGADVGKIAFAGTLSQLQISGHQFG